MKALAINGPGWPIADARDVRVGTAFDGATVEADVGREQPSGAIKWRMRCLCGESYVRTTADLMQRARAGISMRCRWCRLEQRRRDGVSALAWKKFWWRRLWNRERTLYSAGYGRRLALALAAAMEEAGHRAPIDMDTSDHVEKAGGLSKATAQQAAYLYPISNDDGLGWECADCGEFVTRAFGCVLCLEATCVECVRAEKHCQCNNNKQTTLATIAAEIGISHSRVDQILDRSLEKLRIPMRVALRDRIGWLGFTSSHLDD